ncbi:MAG TPA: hypothetical protein VJC39_05335 [Candidatus Nanoarchaeia archaeon]|nr:hypothetical protein [Candidatus Nanoarchaeia archaeon]
MDIYQRRFVYKLIFRFFSNYHFLTGFDTPLSVMKQRFHRDTNEVIASLCALQRLINDYHS